MTNETLIDRPNNTGIDALFSSARQSQPSLVDDNFTKMLLNSLPQIKIVRKDTSKKGLSFDLIGALIGVLMAYLFVDRTALVSAFVGMIPETLVISPTVVLGAVGAVGLSSIIAWWVAADSQL